ncbi:uncharacterized protein TM35_000391420 [Trypanosoma theileri]|uniref:Uncharacterized protein n=1 Tax=Trypanosoma theileri TaxID=67003 RepID=A0A1X0NKC2_9TRYP|nr:uncharacterized protein TM35_000391420 [Trypanosoma theileri]ORC84968.1 hypothetical protein TM35_000391420 [Trypanosoma theileri]
MPYVIVNCTFNPPTLSITGAQLRQETIDSLEKSIPQCTTTSSSSNSMNGTTAKFTLSESQPQTWHMSIGQQYCDQRGRCVVFAAVAQALQLEGWALRTTDAVSWENEKDVTRLFFWRSN